jgi:adenine-specific DNA-methyltransferase
VLRVLKPSGVLATLLPAGVLASDRLSKWRERLLERATPSLIAVLGEHGLFEHALVNVGILALEDNSSTSAGLIRPLHVAWSSAESGAASRVIRAIRRSTDLSQQAQPRFAGAADWSVTIAPLKSWKQRPSWLPGAGMLGVLLEKIEITITTKVRDLFRVLQGIRTGANDVFIQSTRVVQGLPKPERRYFSEAVDAAASFINGEIQPSRYLFRPDRAWTKESDLKREVPEFYGKYLLPSAKVLRKRKSLRGRHWWELSEARSWAFGGGPRLVSKRFGLFPAFARDPGGKFAVVQANAWRPTQKLSGDHDEEALRELLTAYWWLLNSRIAVALFREYCPNVAGGQLDLEHKYVSHVPLPNLVEQFRENPALQVLAASIRTRSSDQLPTLADRDQFAATSFGTDVSEWNLLGLEQSN